MDDLAPPSGRKALVGAGFLFNSCDESQADPCSEPL